ncbi:MAG: hypothetical protein MMC23_005177 [Stictis urceolatum]|nr:hypothetical protein [Stictis urceolata]
MGEPKEERKEMGLIYLYQTLNPFFDSALMASSDVDQKFLGQFAHEAEAQHKHAFLSSMLYKILGLSVLLSKKLVRARKLRRLDTTRDTKSLQLYHHIIWLSREGLVITEQYILPMVNDYIELKVLACKLRASFYHIFVLFHNQPSIHQTAIPSFTSPMVEGRKASAATTPDIMQGGPVQQSLPPGLTPISIPKPAASFLLPAIDYVPMASHCFAEAAALAEDMLTGSHPLRASVKVEYAAYLYDCLHDHDGSRKLAQASLRDVYTDPSGMEDEMFEETAKLVVILDKMARRGLGTPTPSARGSATSPSTPRSQAGAGPVPPLPGSGTSTATQIRV